MPLLDLVDKEKELERLNKEVKKLNKTCFTDSPAFPLPHPGGFGDIASRRSGHQRAKITNYFYTTRYFVPFFSQTRQFLTTFAAGESEKHTFGGE